MDVSSFVTAVLEEVIHLGWRKGPVAGDLLARKAVPPGVRRLAPFAGAIESQGVHSKQLARSVAALGLLEALDALIRWALVARSAA